jgi:hypothetical protein
VGQVENEKCKNKFDLRTEGLRDVEIDRRLVSKHFRNSVLGHGLGLSGAVAGCCEHCHELRVHQKADNLLIIWPTTTFSQTLLQEVRSIFPS